VGAGPAGLAAAGAAVEAGGDVVLLERSANVGGQLVLAGAAPGSAAIATAFLANHERTLDAVDLRLEVDATADVVAELLPDVVIVATGARPYRPPLDLAGVEVTDAWAVLAGAEPALCAKRTRQASVPRRVVVADWGGDPAGLDVTEVLADAGHQVTLAVASVTVGESVHQYRRNLYLQRLYRKGVEIRQHLELAGAAQGAVRLRNAFAPELETAIAADTLVLALGRVPVDDLAPKLSRAGLRVEEAGDCLSPRSLEEAVLEGTLAARRAFRVGSPAES
jgi:pyruvate/2-oxoglutarate dehydrogenase complex dihydrolipoamide dehydrogenase (E3) component